jgi:hypothetical protein
MDLQETLPSNFVIEHSEESIRHIAQMPIDRFFAMLNDKAFIYTI